MGSPVTYRKIWHSHDLALMENLAEQCHPEPRARRRGNESDCRESLSPEASGTMASGRRITQAGTRDEANEPRLVTQRPAGMADGAREAPSAPRQAK
jgi:hypothetical protein